MEKEYLKYSQALYMLAVENNAVEFYQDEVKTFSKLFSENNKLLSILNNAFLSLKERFQIIDKIFEKSSFTDIKNFIKILVEKHEILNVFSVFKSFNSLCNKRLGVKEGIIYSVENINNATVKKFESVIEKKIGSKIELYNVIDLSLIGGVKILVDDMIFDGSVKHKIVSLKKYLMERK